MKKKPDKSDKIKLDAIVEAFDGLKKAFEEYRGTGTRHEELAVKIEKMESRIVDEIRDRTAIEHMVDERTKDAVKDANKRLNLYLGCFLFVLAIGVWPLVQTYTHYVTVQINNRIVEKQVDRTISQQSASMISNTVPNMIKGSVCQTENRLKTEFSDYVSNRIDKIGKNSEALAKKMKENEARLERRLEYIPKMEAARAGSRYDYEELKALLNETNELAAFVKSTVEGIESHYWSKKISKEDFYLMLPPVRGKKLDAEQYVDIIHADRAHNCDGAINELVALGRKEFVSTLIYAVENSKRLNSVYLAIAGIEKLVGRQFSPLGIDEVRQWWRVNCTNEAYNSPYESYCVILEKEGVRQRDGEGRKDVSASSLLAEMAKLMNKSPEFMPVVKSVLIQIVMFPVDPMRKFADGRKAIYEQALDHAKAKEGNTDMWWNFKAYYDVYYGDFLGTVTNRLAKSPSFEEEMKRSGFYNPGIFDDSKFNWPSKNPKPKQTSVPLTPANAIKNLPRPQYLMSSADKAHAKDCVGGVWCVSVNITKGKRVLTELSFTVSETITEKLSTKCPPAVVRGDTFSWTLDGVERKYVFDGDKWTDSDGKDAGEIVLPYGRCPISYERIVDKATTISFAGSVNIPM